MNENEKGRNSGFLTIVGRAGADFKRAFTLDSYKAFFKAAGYENVEYAFFEGRVPCAVAVIRK